MRPIRSLPLALLALCFAGSTFAVPPAGSGGGYYGTAWFDSNQGIVVSGATWYECNQALQSGISYRVSNWGWSVTSMTPCSYQPPFSVANPHVEVAVDIVSGDPQGSLDEATVVLARIAELRRLHDMDRYEATLGELITGGGSIRR